MPFFERVQDRLILSCSAFALCGIPSQLWADCTPDPTVANSVTICAGTDGNGLTVSTFGTSVNVQTGTLVQNGSIVLANNNGVTVNGSVQGGGGDGLLFTNGAPYQTYVPYDPYAGASPNYNASSGYLTIYPGNSAALSVGNTGIVTGIVGVRIKQRPDNSSGLINVSIQNGGLISGTAGPAIVAESGTAITYLNNLYNGTIGGISGAVQYVNNAGAINGGASSALNSGESTNVYNSGGTLTANSAAPTLAISSGTVDNRGRIVNVGSGAAITAAGALTIYNRDNGVIDTSGPTAIATSGQLYILNGGRITGSIDAHQATAGATIDTTGGTIAGDILLGSGNDLLRGGILDVTTGTFSNIGGIVDGGSGVDTVDISLAANATLNAIALPTNFEKLQLSLVNNAVITLGQELDLSAGLMVGGTGSIIIDRDITSTEAAISVGSYYSSNVGFVNSGTITATLGTRTDFAVALGQAYDSSNSGSIIGIGGGGVRIATNGGFDSAFVNTGSITADTVAAQIFGRIDNSGTIQSTGGIGVVLQSGYADSSNSGTIEGETAGLRIESSAAFVNTGTISATGVGVDLGYFARFDNRVGGIVSGTMTAIGMANYGYGSIIQNAGTLNGDVKLVPQQGYDSSSDIFVDNGGIVNGNLLLGAGDDILVTDLARSGRRAGVTGTVDAGSGYDTIRYRVGSDNASTLAVPNGFEELGYDLSNGAKLVLTASGSQTLGVAFSGQGSVDLNADLAQTDHIILDMGASTVAQLMGTGGSMPSDLTVISRGNLSLTSGTSYYYGLAAVQAATASFENAGTITVTGMPGGYYMPSAIFNGATVVNSGRIRLDGAIAVNNAVKFINTGAISQTAGGASSQGVTASQVENSGTISVDYDAVTTGYNYSQTVVSNSGVIESKYGTAILASGGTITNAVGGMISGAVSAIQSDSGGSIVNAGHIDGDVRLGSSYYYSGQGKYVANGGTLDGNLTFGSANDVMLTAAGVTGVSGTIDAGTGSDYFGRFYRNSANTSVGAALPATFERELVESVGAATIVTLTDSGAPVATSLYIGGDGQIINQAVMTGRLTAMAEGSVASDGIGVLAKFTNKATLASGFEGITRAFVNEGVIGSSTLTNVAVDMSGSGDMDFANSGTISAADGTGTVRITMNNADQFSFTNSGTILGDVAISERYYSTGFQTASVTNSGHISANSQFALSVITSPRPETGTLTVTNGGIIENSASGGAALRLDRNYGNGALPTMAIDNGGTIRETGAGFAPFANPFFLPYSSQASAAIMLTGSDGGSPVTITNRLGGLIEANQYNSAAILSYQSAVVVDNAGMLSGGAGTNLTQTLQTYMGLPVTISYHLAGAIQTGTGNDIVRNSGTIIGSIDLGDGEDIVENRGQLNGDVVLGDGNDRFITVTGAGFTGTGDGGGGSDTLLFDISGGGTIDAALYSRFVNFENFGLTGTGVVALQGLLPIQTLMLENASFELQVGSTLQTLGPVAITGTSGDDQVINHGAIIGDVMLGDGADQFTAYANSSVSGIVDAGAGNDRLALYFDSPAAGATPINFAPYSGFEQLGVEGGTGFYNGTVTFDRVDVDGGRLIGLAGSTLNASQGISVASNATFGSAGTVNGAITVTGTLSPGASPGTMTVNGNVMLAGGSRTLYEMTPTISDALTINGRLTIQSGATLNVTGTRPLTPGLAYNLITASDGITGAFSTISKASTVLGYIRQTTDAVQLLGLLQMPTHTNAQIAATGDYINRLLMNGASTSGIDAALPGLVDTAGIANPAALSRLQPEAYASASQIGIDTGLTLSSAMRSMNRTSTGDQHGLFAVGQALGNWRRLRGDHLMGVSGATLNGRGFLGGIGVASGSLSATISVGRMFTDQALGALDASTKTDGTFVGANLGFVAGSLNAGGTVLWDGGSADTRRPLQNRAKAAGHYRLNTLSFDGYVGYRFDVGQSGWRVGPQLGLTHISVRRGALTETGGGVFSLNVARQTTDATFLNVDLELSGGLTARMRPWLSAGWRHQVSGDSIVATAAFRGVTDQFTTIGVERARDFARIEGGFDWSLTRNLDLFAKANSEFDGNVGAQGATIGLCLGL